MTVPHDRILRKGDYLNGSFLRAEQIDGYINAVNPGDRTDLLGRFPFSVNNVDDAADAASRGARSWRRVGLMERAAAVMRFREALQSQAEVAAKLLTRETGKPLWEARQEVAASLRAIDLYLDDGLGLIGPKVIEEIGARSDYLPRGIVGMVLPYNLPLLLGSSLTAACILGGNALMVKPSKFTPVTGQLIAELWDRCKLPRGVFNLVQGSGSVIGQRLLGHAALDAVLFHGSYESAREVRRILADRPELPVLYQCGGKGLAIVLEDADIDRAVYEILVGTCLSTGQRHNSTARVLISQRIYTVFVTRLIARLKHIKIGYGFNEDILMGPLISEGFRGRFRKFSAALAARGHQPLYEGQPVEIPGHRGSYVRPSIYEIQWENGHPFLNDEPPGPTLLLYRVKDWEEAAHLHNQAAFRSTTSIFMAHDSPLLPDIRDALKTGAINVNRTTVGSSLRLPSSALGRSGNGLPSGLDLMRLVTWPRASIVEHRPFEATNLVPGIGWEEQEDTETTMEFSVE